MSATLKRILDLALARRARYAAGFALLAGTNLLALAIPWWLGRGIDAMAAGGGVRAVAPFAAAIAATALVQAAVRTGSRAAILGASRRIAHDVRARFFARVLTLDAASTARLGTGDLMSRGVNDVQQLRSLYGPGAMNLVNTTLVYLVTIAAMIRIDAWLTLIALAPAPLLVVGVQQIGRRVYQRSLAVQRQLAVLSGRVQEALNGILHVKAFAGERREAELFRAVNRAYFERQLALTRLRGLMLALIGIVSGGASLLVLWAGGRYVIGGRITLGEFVAFHAYLAMLTWPTIALGWILNVFQRGAGAIERIGEVVDARPSIPSPLDQPLAPRTRRRPARIEIAGLRVRHPGATRDALNIDALRLEPGTSVAIVGPIGSGKTTLLDALVRLVDVPAGTIRLGGRDVTSLPTSLVRRTFALVPQESFLFSRSLRDNLLLGATDAGDDEIARAVEIVRLERDLARLPEGLDTVVGERGHTLSGGQRQRVALARALLVRADWLLLDDALSSVDSQTEREILDGLATEAGRGVLFVTHRYTAMDRFDRVLVLDGGRLVGDGRHEALQRRCELYRRLVHRQRLIGRLDAP